MPKSVDLSTMSEAELAALENAIRQEKQTRHNAASAKHVQSPQKAIDYLMAIATLDEEYDDAKVEAARASLKKAWPKNAAKIDEAVELAGDMSNDHYELESMDQDSDEFFELEEQHSQDHERLDLLLHSLEY